MAHEVVVGSLIHLWDNKWGIVTEIGLINGKPKIAVHYISDEHPNLITTLHCMYSELEESKKI
jgi:hypothetical protein